MKFFDFSWFSSLERKKLRELQIQEKELSIELLEKKLVPKEENNKPYRKLIYSNGNITAILADGVVINKKGVDGTLFQQVKDAYSEDVIRGLLAPDLEIKPVQTELYTKEEIQVVKDCVDSLKSHPDFEFIGDNVFLKGVALPLVPVVLASYIELVEKIAFWSDEIEKAVTLEDNDKADYNLGCLQEKFEALKMFWRWTALNPIESSRNDLLKFVKENEIKLTNNGQLVLYRRANLVKELNPLVDFVSREYFKYKQWKKSPKNYNVVQDNDGTYQIRPCGHGIILGCQKLIGNLEDLYLNLPNLEGNHLTDAHTGKMKIVVGDVYKIEEDKVDLNNNRDCSSGLHLASRRYDYSGFGNTPLLCIANPSKIRSVPISDTAKVRVSEMYIASVLEIDEKGNYMDEGIDVVNFDNDYFKLSVEELEKELENKSFNSLSCQDNAPVLSISSIQDITKALRERVVSI